MIMVGIVVLLLAVAWEVYQISSGNRDKFNLTVNSMPREVILTPEVREHLKTTQL